MRNVRDFTVYVFFWGFYGFESIIFKSLTHFEFILVCEVRSWSSFIFCTYLSNFPNTMYWIDYLLSIACFCLLCQILIDYKSVGLFLRSLFCSIDLYVCFYACTMLFWFLWPHSIVLYQVVLFFQLCLLYQEYCGYLDSCGSIYIFGIFALVLSNKPLVSWQELHWIYKVLWVVWTY